jgi:CRP-like cAMP-binding protein
MPPVPAPVELLQSVPLFSSLGRRDLGRLSAAFKERTYEPGETVAQEGANAVGFFIIGEGTAEVTVRGEERRTLGPGDHFGEIALIDSGERTATVTAGSQLRCYAITSWDFKPLVEGNAAVSWQLLQGMARMLRTIEQGSS